MSMPSAKLTIIIPTRERADTLLYAIKSCVSQEYDNLTILVSDNFSTDHTREVVASFSDKRVTYINTGRRMSMTENFEFGLSHVQDGYVSVLGDDDGFLPGSLKEVNQLLTQTNVKAINLNPANYLWPSFYDATNANMLQINFRSGYRMVNGQDELKKTIAGKASYTTLPCIYTSFIDVSLINTIKQKTGLFFHSRIPDVYSGIALAGYVGDYICMNKSLKLFGTSAKSTGVSLVNDATNQQAAQMFMKENTIPIHPAVSSTLGRSICLVIAESLLQAFDQGLNASERPLFDMTVFAHQAVQEAFSSARGHQKEILDNVWEIVRKNNLDPQPIQRLIEQYTKTLPGPIAYDVTRFFHPFALVDAATFGASDVAGAAELYDRIYHNPLRYPSIIPSTIKKIAQSATLSMLLDRFKRKPPVQQLAA